MTDKATAKFEETITHIIGECLHTGHCLIFSKYQALDDLGVPSPRWSAQLKAIQAAAEELVSVRVREELEKAHRAHGLQVDNATDEYICERLAALEAPKEVK